MTTSIKFEDWTFEIILAKLNDSARNVLPRSTLPKPIWETLSITGAPCVVCNTKHMTYEGCCFYDGTDKCLKVHKNDFSETIRRIKGVCGAQLRAVRDDCNAAEHKGKQKEDDDKPSTSRAPPPQPPPKPPNPPDNGSGSKDDPDNGDTPYFRPFKFRGFSYTLLSTYKMPGSTRRLARNRFSDPLPDTLHVANVSVSGMIHLPIYRFFATKLGVASLLSVVLMYFMADFVGLLLGLGCVYLLWLFVEVPLVHVYPVLLAWYDEVCSDFVDIPLEQVPALIRSAISKNPGYAVDKTFFTELINGTVIVATGKVGHIQEEQRLNLDYRVYTTIRSVTGQLIGPHPSLGNFALFVCVFAMLLPVVLSQPVSSAPGYGSSRVSRTTEKVPISNELLSKDLLLYCQNPTKESFDALSDSLDPSFIEQYCQLLPEQMCQLKVGSQSSTSQSLAKLNYERPHNGWLSGAYKKGMNMLRHLLSVSRTSYSIIHGLLTRAQTFSKSSLDRTPGLWRKISTNWTTSLNTSQLWTDLSTLKNFSVAQAYNTCLPIILSLKDTSLEKLWKFANSSYINVTYTITQTFSRRLNVFLVAPIIFVQIFLLRRLLLVGCLVKSSLRLVMVSLILCLPFLLLIRWGIIIWT